MTIIVKAETSPTLRAFLEGVEYVNDSALTVREVDYERIVAVLNDADSDDDREITLDHDGSVI